jgi:topoisomerase (DNA) II binding protein 1
VQEKLRKVLNSSGATRFEDLCDGLSHVIMAGSGLSTSEASTLSKLGRRPAVVPLTWLLSSIEQRHPAEAPAGPSSAEPPSPLSKRGMQIFDPPTKVTISPRYFWFLL